MTALRATIAGAGLALLLAACTAGPGAIRSEPPGLQVDSLELADSRVELGLLVHNRNDHPIALTGAQLAMRVEGEVLFDDEWPLAIDIGPRVRERIRLETTGRAAAVRRLRDIMAERGASAAYLLSGTLRADGADHREREVRGFLHPVPGQPGHFR